MLDIDVEKAAFMLAEATEASIFVGDFLQAAETGARAAALAPPGSAARAYADGVRGTIGEHRTRR